MPRRFQTETASYAIKGPECLVKAAVSMGRRNTRSKPKRRAFSSQGSFANVDSTEHLPG
jgi:hypothetical protein